MIVIFPRSGNRDPFSPSVYDYQLDRYCSKTNIDNDTVEDFLILFKDEKDLLRAFGKRLGFKVEHLS